MNLKIALRRMLYWTFNPLIATLWQDLAITHCCAQVLLNSDRAVARLVYQVINIKEQHFFQLLLRCQQVAAYRASVRLDGGLNAACSAGVRPCAVMGGGI
ncbi:hypothetical protein COO60DRAFT_823867 [Scenedesmus sp. NREL 46B-D3]|nr:hypothetical protein COO60DRAFT_823867 [Scenedesmus sp. NREL 46B-D3]